VNADVEGESRNEMIYDFDLVELDKEDGTKLRIRLEHSILRE